MRRYALRKQTPEPVFGIIKSVLGFRQFLLRGLDKVRGEWSLVTMAWNIKRMFTLSSARQAGRGSRLRKKWPQRDMGGHNAVGTPSGARRGSADGKIALGLQSQTSVRQAARWRQTVRLRTNGPTGARKH